MKSVSMPEHPLESIYNARTELENAAQGQRHTRLEEMDWTAYGSALVGTLAAMAAFAGELVTQINEDDRERLYRRALQDHPHEALDRAVEHLSNLRHVLNQASEQAQGYWSEVQHIQETTTHPRDETDESR
ncbi:hypothetical protein SAMN04487820_104331 [Actinopolyspora mzabensis]|uniref:Uncharacterized protein n=2 Tax=Actinopolyspora mzabensis TaxID=995066 RepID=A0A1G8ZA76_ACTMZ|nr:hypothetical protein SAMN04487820_104331 [Actinopolyspora mzabensis]